MHFSNGDYVFDIQLNSIFVYDSKKHYLAMQQDNIKRYTVSRYRLADGNEINNFLKNKK